MASGAIVLLSSAEGQQKAAPLLSFENEPTAFTVEKVNNDVADGLLGQNESCTSAYEPTNFARFSLGKSFGALELDTVRRRCVEARGEQVPDEDFVSYLYGQCNPTIGEGICAPPVEIQSWPACKRSLADYEVMPGQPMLPESLVSKGMAKVAKFDNGLRAEVYTADSTVVIYGMSQRQVDEALAVVRLEDPDAPANQILDTDIAPHALKAPEAGAMEGRLSCSL